MAGGTARRARSRTAGAVWHQVKSSRGAWRWMICRSLPVLTSLAFLAVVPLAQADDRQAGVPADRCEHPLPGHGGEPGDKASGSSATHTNGEGGHDLSRKLGDCGGVLRAPGVGDGGMVAPAPEIGRERVIKPGMLPPDTNSGNGG